MDPQDAIDYGREAIKACLMVGGPILLVSLLVGLLIGLVQAMTQVQDQSVAFVPKIVSLLAIIALCLPWIADRIVGYSAEVLEKPVTHIHSRGPVRHSALIRMADRSNFELPKYSTPSVDDEEDGNHVKEEPTQSPFILPHYRYSRAPKQNIDG